MATYTVASAAREYTSVAGGMSNTDTSPASGSTTLSDDEYASLSAFHTGGTSASTESTVSQDVSLHKALDTTPSTWNPLNLLASGPTQAPGTDSASPRGASSNTQDLTTHFVNNDADSGQLTPSGMNALKDEAILEAGRNEVGGKNEVVGKGERVQVEFKLVSGMSRKWVFGESATIQEVREVIWKTWPSGAFQSTKFGAKGADHSAMIGIQSGGVLKKVPQATILFYCGLY